MNLKYELIYFLRRFKKIIPKKPLDVYLNNRVILIKKDGVKKVNPAIKNLITNFKGCNNTLILHEPISISGALKLQALGDGAVVEIGKCARISNLSIVTNPSTKTYIGDYFSCGNVIITQNGSQNTTVKIGNDCMFSYGVIVRTSDTHGIYSLKTKELLNPSKDVEIKDHVWLCAHSQVIKGGVVGANSVVGTMSIVNKAFDENNVVLAGVPAKVVKREIDWDRRAPYLYKPKEQTPKN